MARALIKALEEGGIQTKVASALQSRDATGSTEFQAQKLADADQEIARLIPLGRSEDWLVWITYHNYYKAPDLIGPSVSKALDIPYVLVEATRARKRLTGPWSRYAERAEAATDAARLVFYLTRRDAEALNAYGSSDQALVHLPPFLATNDLPAQTHAKTQMISVGMFRRGDKLASYEIIAQTLAHLSAPDWQLSIAGTGPAEPQVRALFRPFGEKVRWLGELDADRMKKAYQAAAILFWPGVNEAFGMTYLEAQAAGLVAVAQNRPGVSDVLAPGLMRPDPSTGAEALARTLDELIAAPSMIHKLGTEARQYVKNHHLLTNAQKLLISEINKVLS